eukprot:gene4066-5561_t
MTSPNGGRVVVTGTSPPQRGATGGRAGRSMLLDRDALPLFDDKSPSTAGDMPAAQVSRGRGQRCVTAPSRAPLPTIHEVGSLPERSMPKMFGESDSLNTVAMHNDFNDFIEGTKNDSSGLMEGTKKKGNACDEATSSHNWETYN